MEKLSAKSIEKIELFLYMEDMNYISLSRHDMELFYSIYNKSVMELLDLEQENQKLKKQLEEYIRAEFKAKDELEKQRQEYQDDYKDVRIEIKSYKNQQKEFIEWLKKKSYQTHYQLPTALIYEKILSKYKEIIGEYE